MLLHYPVLNPSLYFGVGGRYLVIQFIGFQIKKSHTWTWCRDPCEPSPNEETILHHSDILEFEFDIMTGGTLGMSPSERSWVYLACRKESGLNLITREVNYGDYLCLWWICTSPEVKLIWLVLVNDMWVEVMVPSLATVTQRNKLLSSFLESGAAWDLPLLSPICLFHGIFSTSLSNYSYLFSVLLTQSSAFSFRNECWW